MSLGPRAEGNRIWSKIVKRARVNEHPSATNYNRRATARVLPGAPGSAADCFCRHRRRGYRSWDVLGVAGTAPKPHTCSSDGDTAIALMSEVVTWSLLVLFTRQRGMKNWVCDGLVFFEAPRIVDSVLRAVGARAAAAPVALSLGNRGSHL